MKTAGGGRIVINLFMKPVVEPEVPTSIHEPMAKSAMPVCFWERTGGPSNSEIHV